MCRVLGLVLVLMVSILTNAYSADDDPRLIVPGERIGPARLRMDRTALNQINRGAGCPVSATYDATGRATSLETNWGGACLISDQVQVGLTFGPTLRAFGKPGRVIESARYPQTSALWFIYEDRGIAFRVIGWPSGTTIQAIAVFPARAASGSIFTWRPAPP